MTLALMLTFVALDGRARAAPPVLSPPSQAVSADLSGSRPSTIYAGPSGGDIYVSTDGGTTWEGRPAGPLTSERLNQVDHIGLSHLLIHPADPQRLFVNTEIGFLTSRDGGESWHATAPLPTSQPINKLTPIPGTPGGLIVSFSSEAFVTLDGGDSWQPGGSILRNLRERPFADPWDRTALYQTERSDTGTSIYRRNAATGSWERAAVMAERTSYEIIVAPTTPPTFYAQPNSSSTSWISTREGDPGWTSLGPLPAFGEFASEIRELVVDPVTPTTLYARIQHSSRGEASIVTYCGVARSTDSGATWHLLPAGLIPLQAGDLTMSAGPEPAVLLTVSSHSFTAIDDPPAPVRAYLAAHGDAEVVWTTPRHQDWLALHRPADAAAVLGWLETVSQIAAHPADPDTFYVTRAGGLFKTSDRGATWRAVLTFQSVLRATHLAAVASAPDRLYALAPTIAGALLQHSTDAGRSWTSATTRLPHGGRSLLVDPHDAGTVYVGSECCWRKGAPPAEIYRTRDTGRTWTAVPVTGGGTEGISVRILLADARTGTLYAGLGAEPNDEKRGGVARSTDSGDTWQVLDTLPRCAVNGLAVAPSDSLTLYAGTACGLFKSVDGGEHWDLGGGLPERSRGELCVCPGNTIIHGAQAIAVHPTNPEIAYLAIGVERYRFGGTGGVFRTSDGGATWVESGDGLPSVRPANPTTGAPTLPAVMALALDPAAPDSLWISAFDYACVGYSCRSTIAAVYHSRDGGRSWQPSGVPAYAAGLIVLPR